MPSAFAALCCTHQLFFLAALKKNEDLIQVQWEHLVTTVTAAEMPDYLHICSTSADLSHISRRREERPTSPPRSGWPGSAGENGEGDPLRTSDPDRQIWLFAAKKSDCRRESYSSRAQMGVISLLLSLPTHTAAPASFQRQPAPLEEVRSRINPKNGDWLIHGLTLHGLSVGDLT